MAASTITVQRRGPVAVATLNRPEVRNAFNEAVVAELTAWAGSVAKGFAAGDVRVALLTGAGTTFCAGADLRWMTRMKDAAIEDNIADAAAMADMFAALDALPVPLVGRVQGAALGGGTGLVTVCDIVIAEDQATFGFTEVRLGVLPAVIAPFAIAKIGTGAARELFLTGARFDALRARALGLVHAVVPTLELDSTVDTYLHTVLLGAPSAIARAKALIREVAGRDAAAVRAETSRAIAEQRVSPEGQEGLVAFLEKRKAAWVPKPQ